MAPTPEEVQALLRAEPFQPLQVRLTDGTTRIVAQSRFNMVTRDWLLLGTPDPSDPHIAADVAYVHWSTIAGVDRLVPEGTSA